MGSGVWNELLLHEINFDCAEPSISQKKTSTYSPFSHHHNSFIVFNEFWTVRKFETKQRCCPPQFPMWTKLATDSHAFSNDHNDTINFCSRLNYLIACTKILVTALTWCYVACWLKWLKISAIENVRALDWSISRRWEGWNANFFLSHWRRVVPKDRATPPREKKSYVRPCQRRCTRALFLDKTTIKAKWNKVVVLLTSSWRSLVHWDASVAAPVRGCPKSCSLFSWNGCLCPSCPQMVNWMRKQYLKTIVVKDEIVIKIIR